MKPLTFFRARRVSAAAALEYIYLPLGNVRLRIVNCNNATPANPPCTITVQIVPRDYLGIVGADSGIALFQGQVQVAGGIDIGWEGDIEIGAHQKLMATFQNSTNLDILYLTVGAEI